MYLHKCFGVDQISSPGLDYVRLNRGENSRVGLVGVWLFYPPADCPPDVLPPRIVHGNMASP